MVKKLQKVGLAVLALCLNAFNSTAAGWIPIHSWNEFKESIEKKSTDGSPVMLRLEKNVLQTLELYPKGADLWSAFKIKDNVILDLNGHTLGVAVKTSKPKDCSEQTVYDERASYFIHVPKGASLRVFDTSEEKTGSISFDGNVMKASADESYCYKKDAYVQQYRNVILTEGLFELYGGSLVAGGTCYSQTVTDKDLSVCEGPAAVSPGAAIDTVRGTYYIHKVVNGNAITLSGNQAEVNVYGGSITANGFFLGNCESGTGCENRPCYCINDLSTALEVKESSSSVTHPTMKNVNWHTGVQNVSYSEIIYNPSSDTKYKDSLTCRNRVNLYGGSYLGNYGANLSPVAIDNYGTTKTMSLKYYPVNGSFKRTTLSGSNKMMLPPLHVGDAEVITKEPQGVLATHKTYYRWMDFSRLDHYDKKDAKYQAYQAQSNVKVKGNAEDYCSFTLLPFGYSVDKIASIEKVKFPVSGNTKLTFSYDTLPALLQQMGYELIPYVKYYFSNNSKEITLYNESSLQYNTPMKDGYVIFGLQLNRKVHYADGNGIDSKAPVMSKEVKMNIVYEEVIIDPSTFTPSITKQPTDIVTDLNCMSFKIKANNVTNYRWNIVGENAASDVVFYETEKDTFAITDPVKIASLAGKKMYCRAYNGNKYVDSDTFSVTCYVPNSISICNYSFPYGRESRTQEEDVKDLKVYYYNMGQNLAECGLVVTKVRYVMFSKTIELPLYVDDKVDVGFVMEKMSGWEYKDGKVPSNVNVANTACDLFVTGTLESSGYWTAAVTNHIVEPHPDGYPIEKIQYLNETSLKDTIPFPNATIGKYVKVGVKETFYRDAANVSSTVWYNAENTIKTSKDTLKDGYYREVITIEPVKSYEYFVDTLSINVKCDILSVEKDKAVLARYYQVKNGVVEQIDCILYDLDVKANNDDYGNVSVERKGNHLRIMANPNEDYKLAYWEDSNSNTYMADGSVYEADIVGPFDLTAVFTPIVKTIELSNIVAPKIGDSVEGGLYVATVKTIEGSYETEVGGYWSDTISDKETHANLALILYLLSKKESLESFAGQSSAYKVKNDSICFILMADQIPGVDESTQVYINGTKVGKALYLYNSYFLAYAKFVSGGEITNCTEISGDDAIRVYLNTTKSTLYVDGVEGANLTISNMLGVEIYRENNVSSNLAEINVSNWANGVYLINVIENGLNKTIKVIKK